MRASKLTDEQLIDRIAAVFRHYGYAGASLTNLSEATGLERASLYHRFPGGKEQMAEAVLLYLGKQLEINLFAPLRAPGEPESKLTLVVKVIDAFYQSGHLPCILETLSLEGATPAIRQALSTMTAALIEALAGLARELGAETSAQAWERATAAVGAIEGSLVLVRLTADQAHFKSAVNRLPEILASNSIATGAMGKPSSE